MTASPRQLPRSALEAIFRVEGGWKRLAGALSLYLELLRRASDRGRVLRSSARLAASLGVSEERIDRWLSRLCEARLVELIVPAPYLVIQLRFWPPSPAAASTKSTPSSCEKAHVRNARVSKLQQQAAAASSKRGDGGPGEGEVLVEEIRDVLGEEDVDVRTLTRGIPHVIIRKALRRVRLTPASQIRKSRVALFRYLLAKLSEEMDVHDF